MKVTLLEHVNLRTTDIKRLEEWYIRILGLKKGYRPPFKTVGRWLYINDDYPAVHLLEVEKQTPPTDPQMEHFCLRATGLKTFLERLDSEKIPYRTVRVPERRVFQIFISDPDSNHMHIDFSPEEADALGL
jgi:catechol 2,3-dioxygenase-like lactoylglutathione lyase family enzyme